jgi:hypothetical protein
LIQTRGRGTWKFNNSLLRDEEFAKKVKDDIKQVIEEYECDPSVDLDNCDKDFNISFHHFAFALVIIPFTFFSLKIFSSISVFSISLFKESEGFKIYCLS